MGVPTGSPHYEKGINDEVAYVFSCPGRHEEKAGRPAAAVTGKNLDILIDILRSQGVKVPLRVDATVTNAWDKVEYMAATNRSEATEKEILDLKNLERLYKEIFHIKRYIISFGDKAYLAVSKLKLADSCKVIRTCHLSMRKLNSIKTDINNNPIVRANNKEEGRRNTVKRLEVIARDIILQLHK
ncbi:MAG: uracil-DNA glycosylase [Clostridia bacterium]|nr:uracil-DNA glycosylase [Clostridia bacterium]